MRQAASTVLVVVVVGMLATSCGSSSSSSSSNSTSTVAASLSFPDLVARVKTGVIRIEATSCAGSVIGTGFLVKPRLVATVEHVVSGATSIKLKRNGRLLGRGTVIGVDRDRDLALLRTSKPISGHDFGFAGRAPRLGEEVAAIGFPLGLPLTVTKGSVSGFNRVIPISGVRRQHMVQTDAAVNPGNSGGPLLSTDTGRVVGLVDLGTSQANGVAFAVSAEVAAPLLKAWATAPQAPAKAVCSSGVGSSGGGGGSATSSAADYSNAVDGALIDSARTRGSLGDLITAVNNGAIAETDADAAINSIIDQRRQLLQAVTVVPAPAAFVRSAQLLRASLVVALSDDLAIQSWIAAMYQSDPATANSYWQRQLQLSNEASAAKSQFLTVYNAKRSALLGLPPLDVAY